MTSPVRNENLSELKREMHDLCQPLTSLQCRLELAQMMGDCESLKQAVDGALEDTQRMFAGIAAIRARILREERPGTE
jgi:hypothetical protein